MLLQIHDNKGAKLSFQKVAQCLSELLVRLHHLCGISSLLTSSELACPLFSRRSASSAADRAYRSSQLAARSASTDIAGIAAPPSRASAVAAAKSTRPLGSVCNAIVRVPTIRC